MAGVLAGLPSRVALSVGAGLGGSVAWPLRFRRHVVVEQISEAFPDRPPAWVEETARACYRHFGREISELARLGRSGGAGLRERVAGGEEVLARYRERVPAGRGALIVTGHIGNWEVAGAFLAACGIGLSAVVKRQRNRLFDEYLARQRRSLGVEPVYMEQARHGIRDALAAGRAVALVADQDAGRRGLFVPFLGRSASTFGGPAKLALGRGVPLFFGSVVRDGEGYRALLEPVDEPPAGPEAVRELTARWVARLERLVRLHPDQYLWFHRRWKTRERSGIA